MNFVTNTLIKLGILKHDLDYHVLRASLVIIFFFFGYQKWFDYEAQPRRIRLDSGVPIGQDNT